MSGQCEERDSLTIEKKALLERIVAENGWAFFTHDPDIAAARIACGADGRYSAADGRGASS